MGSFSPSMKSSYVNEAIIISASDMSNSSIKDKNSSIPGISPIDITIRNSVKVAKHPLETGEVVLDNKVYVPIEVNVRCLVSCESFYGIMRFLLKLLYDTSGKTFTIRTKTDDLEGLILYDIVEHQTTEKFDSVEITLKFTELITAKTKSIESSGGGSSGGGSNPSNKSNSPKVDSGISKTVEMSIQIASTFFSSMPG